MTILILILAALAGGLFSLIGGILLLDKRIKHNAIVTYAMPFAAGALLGAAFFSILPEALHLSSGAHHAHETHQIAEEGHHEEANVHGESTHAHAEEAHHEETLASAGHKVAHHGEASSAHHEDEHAATEHAAEPAAAHEEEHGGSPNILVWVLAGFVVFFILERGIRGFHRHHEHAGENSHKSLIIIGDTLHNAIDGVAIGAAFLVSVPVGITAAIAVAAHEIPQEIGDFGFLLSKGMKARRVLIVNVLSSLAALVTALITFALGPVIEPAVPFLLAIVAGMFIYIAAADIIPAIHEQPRKRLDAQTILLLAGIIVIPLFAFIMANVFGISHSH